MGFSNTLGSRTENGIVSDFISRRRNSKKYLRCYEAIGIIHFVTLCILLLLNYNERESLVSFFPSTMK